MSIDISHLFVYSGLGWSPVGVVLPSLMAHDKVAFPEHEEEQSIFPSWRVSLCAYKTSIVFISDNDVFYSLTQLLTINICHSETCSKKLF